MATIWELRLTVRATDPHGHTACCLSLQYTSDLRSENRSVADGVKARVEEEVAASQAGQSTESRRVDVLRREQEEVDADSGLDALFRGDAVERILGNEECLLLLRAVELAVFTVLESSETDRRKRGLEDVQLASERFLRVRRPRSVNGPCFRSIGR